MKLKARTILLALILLFVLIEAKGLFHYENSDENIYFYMGLLVSEGNMPYRDFFFSHPPLQIVVNAFIIKLFGFKLYLLKLVPLVATIISACFIYRIARRFSAEAAITSSAIFLFSYTIMHEATYALGINLTTAFVVAAFYYCIKKMPVLGGILFGLASITGLYSLVVFIVVAAALFIKSRKQALKLAASFSAVFIAVNLFSTLASSDYLLSVYKYHLIKPAILSNTAEVFLRVIKPNLLLIASSLLFIFFRSKRLLLPAAVSAVYIAFLLFLDVIFNFYFVLLFPFLSLLAGYSLVKLYERTNLKKAALAVFALLFLTSTAYSAIHLLAFDFQNFGSAKEIASFVEQNSGETDTIFGDSTAVPLIALFSGRRITADIVDTNEMVFLSGVMSLEETIRIAESARFIIVRPLYGIGDLPEFRLHLNKNCRIEKHIQDKYWGDFLVYSC